MTEQAKAYGAALFSLCSEEGIDSEVLTELRQAAEIFSRNPDYSRLMQTPRLKKSQRLDLLRQTFEGRCQPYALNFLCVLVQNDMLREFPDCERSYEDLYDEAHGILRVTAVTAVPLSETQRQSLVGRLAKVTGKTIELTERVDPSVLGGVSLNLNGREIDGTARSRLEALRESLLALKA